MKVLINKEGGLQEIGISRRLRRFLEWRWRWLLYQLALNAMYFALRYSLKVTSFWLLVPILIQYILLYWQLRSYRWKGIPIDFMHAFLRKGEVIEACGGPLYPSTVHGLVYKIDIHKEYSTVWIWPMRKSRRHLVRWLNVLGVKIFIAMRLIK